MNAQLSKRQHASLLAELKTIATQQEQLASLMGWWGWTPADLPRDLAELRRLHRRKQLAYDLLDLAGWV